MEMRYVGVVIQQMWTEDRPSAARPPPRQRDRADPAPPAATSPRRPGRDPQATTRPRRTIRPGRRAPRGRRSGPPGTPRSRRVRPRRAPGDRATPEPASSRPRALRGPGSRSGGGRHLAGDVAVPADAAAVGTGVDRHPRVVRRHDRRRHPGVELSHGLGVVGKRSPPAAACSGNLSSCMTVGTRAVPCTTISRPGPPTGRCRARCSRCRPGSAPAARPARSSGP